MNESNNLAELKRLAYTNIETARNTFETFHPKPLKIICFHARQAVEFMLKCFLVFVNVEPPKNHDIRKFYELCTKHDSSFVEIYDSVVLLTRTGDFPRNPIELELVEPPAADAIEHAEIVTRFINMKLGVVFCDIKEDDDALYKYAVVVSKYKDKWVFCKNINRKWELPGGTREKGEAILETAKRELHEETGAIKFDITPVCAYSINSYGMVFFAEITEFGDLPESEIEKIDFFKNIPDELSFPLFHPKFLEKTKKFLRNK